MSSTEGTNTGPVVMPKRPGPPLSKVLPAAYSAIVGLTLGIAVFYLLQDEGMMGIAKSVLITLGGTLVSYGVNRYAVEKGAELASTGFVAAGIFSVFSILFVGGAIFPATYAGIVGADVNVLVLQEYFDGKTRFIGERNKVAGEAASLIPVAQSNLAELERYKTCELDESCLSGRGEGGRGTVAKALESLTSRASDIAAELEAGVNRRAAILVEVNDLIAKSQTELGLSDKPIRERRQELIKIDARIDQRLAELDESLPVELIDAYAAELGNGVSIPDRPMATERLNGILAKQGQSLRSVLSALSDGQQERETFPAKAGVSTAFAYLGHFAPIALLAAATDLVLPITIWVYAFLALVWTKYKIEQARAADGEDPTPPWDSTPPNGHSPRGRRGRSPDHSGRFN